MVAGRKPALAVENFLAPLRRAISCVTDAVINVGGGYHEGKEHALALAGGKPVPLAGACGLSIVVVQRYKVVEAEGRRGPWKVHTLEYAYSLHNSNGPLMAYHWHPSHTIDFPHLHLYQAEVSKCHLPTNRVSLEEVLRMAIIDLGAKPIRDDWEDILKASQDAHEQWRTWPTVTST